MKISHIRGMILDTAPTNSEAIAVLMCSGFNTRNAVWRFEIQSKEIELELDFPRNLVGVSEILDSTDFGKSSKEPWRLPHETLWKITSGNQGKLKYIYIFPNPMDKQRLDSLDELELATDELL